jgi:hypothetical protein
MSNVVVVVRSSKMSWPFNRSFVDDLLTVIFLVDGVLRRFDRVPRGTLEELGKVKVK